MGQVVSVLTNVLGMITDSPPDEMPAGYVRRIVDFLPLPALSGIQTRGPWINRTGNLTHIASSTIKYLVWCPFSGGDKVVYVDSGGQLSYVVTLDGTDNGTSVTTLTNVPVSPPVYHRDASGGMLILPGSGAAGIAQKWIGTGAVASLGGTPPKGSVAASWGDYLLLAGNAGTFDITKGAGGIQGSRLYFSAVGNPESWDTTKGFQDFPEEITAIVPKGKMLFVFGNKGCHLYVGDIPPPGGNMTLQKFLFTQGCPDPKGVTTYKNTVIWANQNGLFQSDGSRIVDLTNEGGISTDWSYDPTGADLTMGVYQNFLVVVTGATCFVYDLEGNAFWEWQNIPATHLIRVPPLAATAGPPTRAATPEELIFGYGVSTNVKIGGLSRSFTSFGGGSDGNNVALSPRIVTGLYRMGSFGEKRFRRSWASYALKNGVTLNLYVPASEQVVIAPVGAEQIPTMSLAATLSGSGANEDKLLRAPFSVNQKREWICYVLTANSGGMRLFGVEQEVASLDITRDVDVRT